MNMNLLNYVITKSINNHVIKDENDTHYGGNPLLGEWITGTCPKCKNDVQLGMNYCSNCGQRLLWNEEE